MRRSISFLFIMVVVLATTPVPVGAQEEPAEIYVNEATSSEADIWYNLYLGFVIAICLVAAFLVVRLAVISYNTWDKERRERFAKAREERAMNPPPEAPSYLQPLESGPDGWRPRGSK